MKKRIFRLELENGDGIYRNAEKSIWKRVAGEVEDVNIHPLPHLDVKLHFCDLSDRELFFGFKDVEQYKDWCFNPYWRIKFREFGVFLSEYEIEEKYIRYGKGQIIFEKKKSLLIKKHDPFYFK